MENLKSHYNKSVRKYLDSAHILYFSFFIMLLMMLYIKDINFEPIDIGAIGQILHPECLKGGLAYNPFYHFAYIVAFMAKTFGCQDGFTQLARIFWFFCNAFAILALIKLCNFVFKNDNMVLVIAVMMALLAQEGQVDQKMLALPLCLFAVYFFLKEKWLFSVIFGSFIFYLHVGFGIWWFLPSLFALIILCFFYKKVYLKQIIYYCITAAVLTLPITVFYLGKLHKTEIGSFFIKYCYYAHWHSSSVLLTLYSLRYEQIRIISTLLITAVFLLGYAKATKLRYRTDNIIPIALGVFMMYISCFVLADVLGSSAMIMLQPLRSILNIEFFSTIFLAFLLSRQIKKGIYFFLIAYVLISFYYHSILRIFFGYENQQVTLNIFYLVLLMYEILQSQFFSITERISKILGNRFAINRLNDIASKLNRLLRHPVVIAIFLILIAVPKLPALESRIKSVFKAPQYDYKPLIRNRDLYNNVVRFINEEMNDKNTFLLVPFLDVDLPYYIKHRAFITAFTPLSENDIVFKKENVRIEDILENDLNYPSVNFFEIKSGKNLYDKEFTMKWQNLWNNLDEATIRHLKKKYKITHVVRETDLPLDFPIIYQTQYFVIYEID